MTPLEGSILPVLLEKIRCRQCTQADQLSSRQGASSAGVRRPIGLILGGSVAELGVQQIPADSVRDNYQL